MILALLALFVPAAASAQDAIPTGKLPDTVAPIAYRLDMTIVPEKERFSGHAEIDVDLKKPASSIFMHGRDLKIARAVAKAGGAETPVTFTQLNALGLAKLDFGKPMAPGRITLKFDYDAPFAGGPEGVYRINVDKEWYSWTQFQSIDARAAFPSFDEPGYKTPFTVSITTTPGFVAASNAPEVSKSPNGAMVTHRYAPTKPLPTYLVAFVVGPFASIETVVPPTPQRSWPLPLRVIATKPNAGKMQYALDESGKIVALLEKYFNQAFPYPKLDQIASPVMPGAMENAGADIYGDPILLLGADATTADKQLFGMVIAHELSHQWFGDLVTPAWWDDIWLNESFANWMGYRIGNEWRPDLNIGTNAIDEAFQAMNLDSLVVGRPIHEKIANDAAINAAFDQITYGKGGQVVAMIAAYMGDTKFRDGVRLHMERHIDGNATTEDFFGAMADAAKDPRVLAATRSFIDQQGVPVVKLSRKGGKLTGTQFRYAYFGASPKPQQWIIPLCVRRETRRTCTLIDKPSVTVSAPGKGVLVPNDGGWGYYRFELDPADWDALIAEGPKLPAGEALAVTDSLWASFYAGHGSVGQLVAAAKSFAGNKDSNVAVDNGLRLAGLERRGLIAAQALPAYRKLLSDIYAPMLAKLGFDPAAAAYASDDPDRQKLRASVASLLVRNARDPGVRAKLLTAADAYLGGDAKALAPEYLTLALTVAVQEKGLPFAKTLADRALSSEDAGLRQSAMTAISRAEDVEIAMWFLRDFNDSRLRGMEKLGGMAGLLGSPVTRDAATDYLLTNFDSFSRGGGGIFAARSAGAFDSLCTIAQADAVEAKLRPQLVDRSTLSLDRALETVRNCARFREAKAGEVSAAVMGAK